MYYYSTQFCYKIFNMKNEVYVKGWNKWSQSTSDLVRARAGICCYHGWSYQAHSNGQIDDNSFGIYGPAPLDAFQSAKVQ